MASVSRGGHAKRRLLNLITALSLLLCAATSALWVRSYIVSDRLFRQSVRVSGLGDDWTTDAVQVGRGRVGMARAVQPVLRTSGEDFPRPRGPMPGFPFHTVAPPQDPDFNLQPPVDSVLGFRLRRSTTTFGTTQRSLFELVFPLWLPFLACAALPAFRAWRWRKDRMLRLPGRCRQCGYDLRATPGRCPECGASQGAAGQSPAGSIAR